MELSHVESVFVSLVRLLLDYPDQLKVEVLRGTATTVLELTPAVQDVPRLIGRSGRTAGAVRLLLATWRQRRDASMNW